MKKFILKYSLLVVVFVVGFGIFNTEAGNYFSIATGSWKNVGGNIWSATSGGAALNAGDFPRVGDVVFIENGNSITVDSTEACSSVQIGTLAGGNGTLFFGGA